MISSSLRRSRSPNVLSHRRCLSSRKVAVCLTDPRDGNQSNNAASGAAHHMLEMSRSMNDVLKTGMPPNLQPSSGTPIPFLQTTGGTVFMFDLWKRGVNPFDTLVEHFKATPDIPTSWLNRNVCLNGMEPYPREVMKEYFKLIKEAKREAGNTQPYIMQSFCAQNDLNNLRVTFEEWKALGDDFWTMPFFSFAKTPWDPCEANPERTAAWFREVRKMTGGTEMYGLKQPEGDMTASYAQCHAEAVRAEVGDGAQLHLHTQGNHSLGQAAVLGAVQGGVTSVDSSFVFGGRGGQEDSFALRYLLQAEGFEVSAWDEDRALEIWERNYEQWYPNTHRYWRPDPIRANIAGGQRSILQAELDGLRQGHRMPEIFDINMTMRCLGGGGVSVTPLADIYARNSLLWVRSEQLRALSRAEAESLRRAPANSPFVESFLRRWATGDGSKAEGSAMDELLGLGAPPRKPTDRQIPLTPDFTKLLLGHNGQHPCPPSALLMHSAMHHLVTDKAQAMADSRFAQLLTPNTLAQEGPSEQRREIVVRLMKALSRVALSEFRATQIHARLAELRVCTSNSSFRATLERELAMAQQLDHAGEAVTSIEQRMRLYEQELQRIESGVSDGSDEAEAEGGLVLELSSEEYARFLRGGQLATRHVRAIGADAQCAALLEEAGGGEQSLQGLLQVCREAGYKTIPMHELIADNNALGEARTYMEDLDEAWLLGLDEGALAQWSLVFAKFRHHPLRLVQRFWRHELGVEKVFAAMSTDPTEADESSFRARPFVPLSIPEPKRLTKLYKRLVRRVRKDIAMGLQQNASDATCAAADSALCELQAALLEKQFWEARAQHLQLTSPMPTHSMAAATVMGEVEKAKVGYKWYSSTAGDSGSGGASSSSASSSSASSGSGSSGSGDSGGGVDARRRQKQQQGLERRLERCDKIVAACQAKLLPLLRKIAVATPGEFNQAISRSIDDPSAHRERMQRLSGSAEQVEKEAVRMWGMVEAQMYNDALVQSKLADGRFKPSDALDLA